jgi:flavodoxin
MKATELRKLIKEEIESTQYLNDQDALVVLMEAWEKIPLGVRMNQGGQTRVIAKEIREKLNNLGYKLVKV